MRDINLDTFPMVEVWRGRRLYCTTDEGPLLFTLPRGAMTATGNKTISFLAFGSASSTQVRLTGSVKRGRIKALAEAIIEMERPTGAGYWRSLP